MEPFLIRIADHMPTDRLRERLVQDANARVLTVVGPRTGPGRVLIAELDRRQRDRVARWPEVALVGGVTLAGRPIRRIRVDQNGRPLPPTP